MIALLETFNEVKCYREIKQYKPLIWHECKWHFEVAEAAELKENCCHGGRPKQRVPVHPNDVGGESAFYIHEQQIHIRCLPSDPSQHSEQFLYPTIRETYTTT